MTHRNAHPSDNGEVTEHEYSPFPSPADEATELATQLRAFRHAYANLVAACRAALTAHHDGEADPWAYIVDELPPAPPGHPLHHPDNDNRVGGGW